MPEDSKKQTPFMQAVKRVLISLEMDDLRNIFFSYRIGPELSQNASKEFIINKIAEKVSPEVLLESKLVLAKMVDMFNQLSSSFKKMLQSLRLKTLTDIYKELDIEVIAGKGTKSEIVEKLVSDVPWSKVWTSKSLRKHLKPKPISVSHLKRLKTEINALKKTMQESETRRTEATVKSLDKIATDIQRVMLKIKEIASRFEADDQIDVEDFIRAFYEQSLDIGDSLSAESLRDANKNLLGKMNIDRWAFTLKGLELLLLHYLLVQVKNLKWKPSMEDFMRVAKEEYEKVKGIGEQAEIPELRENVCKRMGISYEIFDIMLADAWEKGLVRLDVGAPIGRSDVKYLKTKGGNLFFYAKFRR